MYVSATLALLVLVFKTYSLPQNGSNRNIQPQRGPVCFDCQVIDQPKSCPHLTICDIGQVCMLREMRDYNTGSLKYHAACEDPLTCAGYLNGKRQTHGCHTCCYLDFCNDHCDLHATQLPTRVPTTMSTMPANIGNGVYCYNCLNMGMPNDCLTFTLCSTDQVCMIRDIFEASTNRLVYRASCENKQVCTALSSVAPSDRCHECCSTDFCNDKCVRHNVAYTTTQQPVTTLRPTSRYTTEQTTQIPVTTDVNRVCYSCNNVDDLSQCLNIAQCSKGQICMLSELAPDIDGKIKYTASCENKQVCEALSGLHSTTTDKICHMCCDVDLCNGNCGTSQSKPTLPVTSLPTSSKQPETTATSNLNTVNTPDNALHQANSDCPNAVLIPKSPSMGPFDTICPCLRNDGALQCYECANMGREDDCSNVVTCQQGKICMIRELPFPASLLQEFATSCASKQVCDVLGTLPGKRDTLCHRCCDTPLCNNACN